MTDHTIPKCYGAIQPTAVFVPLLAMRDSAVFELVTTEVFGPFQVISEFEGAHTVVNTHTYAHALCCTAAGSTGTVIF